MADMYRSNATLDGHDLWVVQNMEVFEDNIFNLVKEDGTVLYTGNFTQIQTHIAQKQAEGIYGIANTPD